MYFDFWHFLLRQLPRTRRRSKLLRCCHPCIQDVSNIWHPSFVSNLKSINPYVTFNMNQFFNSFFLTSAHRAGIIPSNSTTYTLSQIQNALKSQIGAIPHLGCSSSPTNSSSNVVLSEVWYYTHVLGTEQYGRFKPVDTTFGSNCESDGILYLERTHGSEREVRA